MMKNSVENVLSDLEKLEKDQEKCPSLFTYISL
jgi:hypothetical protein